jgi:hypothetical protein
MTGRTSLPTVRRQAQLPSGRILLQSRCRRPTPHVLEFLHKSLFSRLTGEHVEIYVLTSLTEVWRISLDVAALPCQAIKPTPARRSAWNTGKLILVLVHERNCGGLYKHAVIAHCRIICASRIDVVNPILQV